VEIVKFDLVVEHTLW